eukprot:g18591.t1
MTSNVYPPTHQIGGSYRNGIFVPFFDGTHQAQASFSESASSSNESSSAVPGSSGGAPGGAASVSGGFSGGVSASGAGVPGSSTDATAGRRADQIAAERAAKLRKLNEKPSSTVSEKPKPQIDILATRADFPAVSRVVFDATEALAMDPAKEAEKLAEILFDWSPEGTLDEFESMAKSACGSMDFFGFPPELEASEQVNRSWGSSGPRTMFCDQIAAVSLLHLSETPVTAVYTAPAGGQQEVAIGRGAGVLVGCNGAGKGKQIREVYNLHKKIIEAKLDDARRTIGYEVEEETTDQYNLRDLVSLIEQRGGFRRNVANANTATASANTQMFSLLVPAHDTDLVCFFPPDSNLSRVRLDYLPIERISRERARGTELHHSHEFRRVMLANHADLAEEERTLHLDGAFAACFDQLTRQLGRLLTTRRAAGVTPRTILAEKLTSKLPDMILSHSAALLARSACLLRLGFESVAEERGAIFGGHVVLLPMATKICAEQLKMHIWMDAVDRALQPKCTPCKMATARTPASAKLTINVADPSKSLHHQMLEVVLSKGAPDSELLSSDANDAPVSVPCVLLQYNTFLRSLYYTAASQPYANKEGFGSLLICMMPFIVRAEKSKVLDKIRQKQLPSGSDLGKGGSYGWMKVTELKEEEVLQVANAWEELAKKKGGNAADVAAAAVVEGKGKGKGKSQSQGGNDQ